MLGAGTVIDGRYEIVAPLAEGGMGAVFLARRRLLGDEVAIKIVRAESANDIAILYHHPSYQSLLEIETLTPLGGSG